MDELLGAVVDAEGNTLHVKPIATEMQPFSVENVSLLQVTHKHNQASFVSMPLSASAYI
jgi:hypothetical protein